MDKLYRLMKPFANVYMVILAWLLAVLTMYLCLRPLLNYTAAAGLDSLPTVLDAMNYYTPDQGYQSLTSLGNAGRNAYRLTNYVDFLVPVLFSIALSLSNLAMGKGSRHILCPLLYMISDYMENIAEKYVLEIYPGRNDTIMTVACYAGLVKMAFLGASGLILVMNGIQWVSRPTAPKKKVK